MAYAFSDTKMAPSVASARGPRGHGPAPWRVLGRLAAACAAAEPGRGEQREWKKRELLRRGVRSVLPCPPCALQASPVSTKCRPRTAPVPCAVAASAARMWSPQFSAESSDGFLGVFEALAMALIRRPFWRDLHLMNGCRGRGR